MSPQMRKTVAAMKAVHDAPQKSPWIYGTLGVLAMAFAGTMWFRLPEQWKVWTGVGLFGAALVPGALPLVAASLSPLVSLFKMYKANGSDGPPSDGSSP